MVDTSDSAILDARFPGYSWMPRWTRRYWTPSTALAFAVFLLSAGNWWGTYRTAPDVQGLHRDLSAITAAMRDECVKHCLLKKEDITLLESHVQDLWEWKKRIDSEGNLTLQTIPEPQQNAPQEARKGKVKTR